jgi:hypothetical protein
MSDQVDLSQVKNDVDLLAYAPTVLATKTKSFFFRYQQFIYGFITGAAVVCSVRAIRKTLS